MTNKKRLTTLAIIIIVLFLSSLFLNSIDNTVDSTSFESSITSKNFNEAQIYAEPESSISFSNDAYDTSNKEQYVVKTGSLELTVNDIDTATNELNVIANTYEGTITNRYIYTRGNQKYGTINIKIAENHFDNAIKDIKEIAIIVNSENINTEDVTEQIIDIQARLKNAQAEETAYISVLEQATTVEDILNVQRYLSNVREEIERYTAQLKYYENQTSYSSITIELTESTTIALSSNEFQPLQTAKNAVQTVIQLFQGLILSIIEMTIIGSTIIVPILIIFFTGKWIHKKYKK